MAALGHLSQKIVHGAERKGRREVHDPGHPGTRTARMSAFRVVVDAASRLAAQAPGGDVLLHEGTGAELLAERAMQEPENGETGIEADEIHELERPHGVIETELQRG